MSERNSTPILFFLLGLLCVACLGGCASVESTSVYYTSYTTKVYPPKPPDMPIPVMEKPPKEPNTRIGRLAFESTEGWRFMYDSMVYNARINGADAVVLKRISTRKDVVYNDVPPQMDWVPMQNYYQRCNNGRVYSYTNWVPYFRPGYTQRLENRIIAIDAEMIVLKK